MSMMEGPFIIGCNQTENSIAGQINFFHGGMYISLANGVFNHEQVSRSFENYLVIIRSKKKIIIHPKHGADVFLPAGVVLCGGDVGVSLCSAQVLIITPELFSNHLDIKFSNGIIDNPYEDITITLFDMVKTFESSINELLAIANLAAMATQKNNVEPKCRVLQDIKSNYLNQNYNLDILCQNVYLSRRKVQYILMAHGTSFSNELKRLRVLKIKSLIASVEKCSGSRIKRFPYYSFKSGFKSTMAAKRDFKIITGMDVNAYIKQLEVY